MKSLFHDYCPHHEPQVVEEGREVAVMLAMMRYRSFKEACRLVVVSPRSGSR